MSARTDSARIGERPTGALWRGGMEMEGWDLRALAVLERLNAAGHRAVLVGGCVRDRLMGRTPHDYDAATSARPEQIREACAPMRVVETGVRHGTVTVLSGGLPVEVTTFRREGRYTDHRRPDRVEFTGDLGEDAGPTWRRGASAA